MRGYVLAQAHEVLPRFSSLEQGFLARGSAPFEAHEAAIRALARAVGEQATVVAFDKLFLTGALLFFGVLPFVFLLRSPKQATAPAHVEVEV
jgi:hypothetical protein